MKNEILMFIFDGYADWECAYLCPELCAPEAGFTVKTLAVRREIQTSMGGIKVSPDYTVEDFPEEFALLLLPGGNTWTSEANDGVLPAVAYAHRMGIPIGAICNACNFLAEHGYLDKVRHTGNTPAYMKSLAPHYQGEAFFEELQAVCDSGIITANGTGTLEFTREILMCLAARPRDYIKQWYQAHKCGYYPAERP